MATSRSKKIAARKRQLRSNIKKFNLNELEAKKSSPKTGMDYVKGQVGNYKNRLKNIGVDPEKAIDTRNPLEKALNLKKDQNVLFDVFEVLNRPQQALFGAVDNLIKHKDVGKGALEGLTGKKETSGGKILRDLGMEGNGKANLFTKEGRKNIRLSDVLGFGLDIFADPLDLIAAPVKVTSTAGKAVKAADNVSDVLSKGTKLVKSTDKLGDTARGISKASSTLNTLGDVGKTTDVAWKPISSILVEKAGKGIKKGVGLSDKAIEKVLGVSDARNLRKAEKYAERTGSTLEDAARSLGISTSKLDVYKGVKNQLRNTVDSSKNIGGLIGKSKEAENIADVNKTIGEKVLNDLNSDIDDIIAASGKQGDEAQAYYRKISDALQTKVDSAYDRTIRGDDVLASLKKGKAVDFFNEDSAKAITDELRKYGIKASNDGRKVTLLDSNSKLKSLSDAFKDKTFGNYLSAEDIVDIDDANKFLNSTPELQELSRKAESAFPNLSRVADDLTGLNASNITKEGYVRHGLTDEGKGIKASQGQFTSSNKAFRGRKFKGTAKEYNRLKEAGLVEKTDDLVEDAITGAKTTKRGENAAKSIYKTDDAGNFILDKEGKPIRDDNLYKELVDKKKNRIASLQQELESSKEILKGKTEGLDAIDETKLTQKGIKNVNTLRAEKDFQETVSELKKIKFELIPEKSSEVIDNLKTSFKDYRKAKTAYTNELKRRIPSRGDINKLEKNIVEKQKLITDGKYYSDYKKAEEAYKKALKTKDISKETLNDLKQTMIDKQKLIRNSRAFKSYEKSKNIYGKALELSGSSTKRLAKLKNDMIRNQKIVTNNINVAKRFQNKQARDIVGNANKAFREGKRTGRNIEKEMLKLKKTQGQVKAIYESAQDLADSLPGQIRYQEAALKKIENSSDAIFASKSKIMEQQAKAANILTSQEGIEFMQTGFMENLADYVKRSPEFNKAAQIYNEALVTGLFNNNKYIKMADEVGDKVPYGFTKVNGSNFANKLSEYNGILPKNSQDLANVMNQFKGTDIYVDNDVLKMFNMANDTSKNQIKPLIKFIDGINNMFKKFSTLTPGFQIRNIVGNGTNMVLSGMPAKDLPVYYTRAVSLWNKSDELMDAFRKGTLTAAQKKDFDILKDFYTAGFAEAYVKGQGLEAIKEGGKGLIGKASKASAYFNEGMDRLNRLTLLMYAKDNPQYVSKLGRKNAVDAVRMVLFDPDNMSDLERNFFKKIIPFYTFTKQNLMFQASNVAKNTPKYKRLFRALNKAYDSVGDDKIASYQKGNMQIPLPFTGSNGEQLFLKANLPVSDLGEFMSNPLQRTGASTAPFIKTPIEIITGKSLFTGEDANYNTLKNTAEKLGIRSQGVQDTAQLAETILNGFGMQNVSTNLIKKVQAVLDKDQDGKSNQQLWAEIFRSVLQNTKRENIVNSGLYDEMQQYQAVIKRLKNQGIDVPTMTEINATNKMKLNRLKRKRAYSR